jgi:hypothetical protein
MPRIRTKNQPWLVQEVSERELKHLEAIGLVLDLDPFAGASLIEIEAPVKEATPKKKADKAPTTENEVKQ